MQWRKVGKGDICLRAQRVILTSEGRVKLMSEYHVINTKCQMAAVAIITINTMSNASSCFLVEKSRQDHQSSQTEYLRTIFREVLLSPEISTCMCYFQDASQCIQIIMVSNRYMPFPNVPGNATTRKARVNFRRPFSQLTIHILVSMNELRGDAKTDFVPGRGKP